MSANRSNQLRQQQTGKHGGCRQHGVNTDGSRSPAGIRRAVLVGVGVLEGCRAVQPSGANVTRISTPNMHVYVAELPVVIILEEIGPT